MPPCRHREDQGAHCVMKKGQTPGASGGGGGRGFDRTECGVRVGGA